MIDTKFVTFERRRVKYAWVYVNYRLEVKVVIPLRYREQDVAEFLRAKSPWIQKKLTHFEKLRSQEQQLETGTLMYLGEVLRPEFDVSNELLLEKWYRSQAKKYLALRVAELAALHGFTYNKITIRSAKTRWGSCSVKKNLSFNWRLMKAPEAVVDYLILHELSHTVVLNHSRKFWQLVAKVCPHYEEAKAWLKENGPRL